MTFPRTRILYAGLAAVLLGGAALAWGQSVPSTPHTPDLLGLYPGMASLAAHAQLQKHSADIYVVDTSATGFGLTIPKDRDMVSVFLTSPPNDPPGVWMVQRTQVFDSATLMSKDVLLGALRQKYGKESLMADHGGGGQYYYWVFDPQSGKLLANADQRYMGCSGNLFITNMTHGPDRVTNDSAICYGSFLGMTLILNMRDAQLLQGYTVELVNMPYAVAAATNTMNANKSAGEKARQDELNKANQNKPTF